jgi:N-acetyl-anhydromuramyl-L-alanine amidase AmpD
MNHINIADMEAMLLRTANKGEYEFSDVAVPLKNEPLTLLAVFAKPVQRSKYFHDIAFAKERIVLHFTAGQLRSDLQALTKHDVHVSVAFVIARNGVIFQLFPSKFWSGHIGKGIGNTGTGNAQDKITIGIELSNYGPLTEMEGNLETIYSRKVTNNGKADVYCPLVDVGAYIKLATPFRNEKFFATHTAEQYDSLIVLLRYLTSQYTIPRQFLPEPQRYEATPDRNKIPRYRFAY